MILWPVFCIFFLNSLFPWLFVYADIAEFDNIPYIYVPKYKAIYRMNPPGIYQIRFFVGGKPYLMDFSNEHGTFVVGDLPSVAHDQDFSVYIARLYWKKNGETVKYIYEKDKMHKIYVYQEAVISFENGYNEFRHRGLYPREGPVIDFEKLHKVSPKLIIKHSPSSEPRVVRMSRAELKAIEAEQRHAEMVAERRRLGINGDSGEEDWASAEDNSQPNVAYYTGLVNYLNGFLAHSANNLKSYLLGGGKRK